LIIGGQSHAFGLQGVKGGIGRRVEGHKDFQILFVVLFQPKGDVFEVLDIGDDVLTIVIVGCKSMVQHAFGVTKAHEGNDPQSHHTGNRGHAL